MSEELTVLCRQRPALRSEEPPGLRWDPAARRGSYHGAELSLSDLDVELPGGDKIVAIVELRWSHRGLAVGGALAIEALAERLARDAGGEVFDPGDDERSRLVDAYLRAREAAYVRARDAAAAANARLADRPLPRTLDELRVALAGAILPADAPEPRTTDPDVTAMFHRLLEVDFDDPADTDARTVAFEQLALTLAREGARIVRGDNDLQRMFAAYGLDAARRDPAVRPELECGGPLAQAIAAAWRAHDALHDKRRAWLRRSWPKIEAEKLKYAPRPPPALQALRGKPTQWPDELVDALIEACDLSLTVSPARAHAGAVFVDRLGLSAYHANEVMSHITMRWPTS